MEIEHVAQRLIKEIEDRTQENIHAMQWDVASQRTEIIENIRKKAQEEVALYKEQELAELRINLIQSESQAKWKVKHDLLKRRSELVDALFEDVRKDLFSYTKNEDYVTHQRESLGKLGQRTDIGNATVLTMEKDSKMFEEILRTLHLGFTVSSTDLIHIGGFILISENKRLEIDHTLDNQLDSQREWFFNHSKLVL